MGRNLLLWLGETEAFLETESLNVFEIDYSAYSQSRREYLIFVSLLLLVSLHQDGLDMCLES